MDEPEALYSKQCSLKQPLRTDSGSLTEVSVLRFNYRTSSNCVCLSARFRDDSRNFKVGSTNRLYNYSGQKSCYFRRVNITFPMEIIRKIEALCVTSSLALPTICLVFLKYNLLQKFHDDFRYSRWISSNFVEFANLFFISLRYFFILLKIQGGKENFDNYPHTSWAHKFLINSNQISLIKQLFVRTELTINRAVPYDDIIDTKTAGRKGREGRRGVERSNERRLITEVN